MFLFTYVWQIPPNPHTHSCIHDKTVLIFMPLWSPMPHVMCIPIQRIFYDLFILCIKGETKYNHSNVSSRCMHNVNEGWTNKVRKPFDHYVWIAQKLEASRVAHGFLKYVEQFPYCSFVSLEFVYPKSRTKTMCILLFVTSLFTHPNYIHV